MKVDGRSLRKCNGANNPNALHTWKEVDNIRRIAKKMSRYGRLVKLAKMNKTTRYNIWKILTNHSYLKRPPKKDSITLLAAQWLDL